MSSEQKSSSNEASESIDTGEWKYDKKINSVEITANGKNGKNNVCFHSQSDLN